MDKSHVESRCSAFHLTNVKSPLKSLCKIGVVEKKIILILLQNTGSNFENNTLVEVVLFLMSGTKFADNMTALHACQ